MPVAGRADRHGRHGRRGSGASGRVAVAVPVVLVAQEQPLDVAGLVAPLRERAEHAGVPAGGVALGLLAGGVLPGGEHGGEHGHGRALGGWPRAKNPTRPEAVATRGLTHRDSRVTEQGAACSGLSDSCGRPFDTDDTFDTDDSRTGEVTNWGIAESRAGSTQGASMGAGDPTGEAP